MRIRPAHRPGSFYHTMLRGNRKQVIFQDDRDRMHLNRLVSASLERYGSRVHAFCWMPNHLHLLVQVGEAPLHKTMHYFATLYAKYFNLRYDLVGHLFEGRYRSKLVESDAYLLQLLRYIHRNPLEGKLTPNVADYRWSSLRGYLGLERIEWLTTNCALSYFAEDPRRLLRFVLGALPPFDPWADLDRVAAQPHETLPPAHLKPPEAWHNLDDLIDAACRRFGVTLSALKGPHTQRTLTLARCWIGQQAIRADLASLSQVARELNRSPSALSQSISRNATRLDDLKS